MKKQENSRTYNSIINSLVGIISSVITIILNFFVRIVIVKQLGEEINGIHNLFQNIINMISIIEIGFSSAMIIHLYKPVKEKNNDKTYAIMKFYKKLYVYISLIFLIIGIFIDVFLIEKIINTTIPLHTLKLYFIIFILINPFNYLTYYKISILYAEQKNRIRFLAMSISELVFRTLQIICTICFKNYYIFLILLIFEKVLCNLICVLYINKEHPYLNEKNSSRLTHEEKKEIYKTVKPIFLSNIALNLQSTAKSLLISILSNSVKIVGYFGNYQLVAGTIQLLFSQLGGAITTSFGNLAVENNKEHMFDVFKKIVFIFDWIAILFCSGFICCIQPFILMVFGKNFILSLGSVALITIDLLIYLYNVPIISVQGAMGLHKEDQYIMIFQSFLSIFLGYMLGIKYNIVGILFGMFVVQFIFVYIFKGMIISKKAFEKKNSIILFIYLKELLKGLFIIIFNFFVCMRLQFDIVFLDFFIKGIISVSMTILWFFVFSRKSENFKYFIELFKTKIRRKKL